MRKPSFGLVFLIAAATAGAHPGVGIVMDSRGNVFYTDLKQVWKIARDGTKTVAVPKVHTHELFLDAEDSLFGEHLWYEGEATQRWGHRVWRLAPDGKLVDVIPASQGFVHDYSFVRDRFGNMFWAEQGARTAIRKRDPSGKVSDLASGGFRDVRWMTCASDGTLFLVDSSDLRRVSPDGTVTTLARQLGERSITQFFVSDRHVLMGLWADASGSVYVAVYGARLVKKVRPNGTVEVVARTRPPWSPTGGFVAPDGALWLLEYSITDAVRVRRIGTDGRSRVY